MTSSIHKHVRVLAALSVLVLAWVPVSVVGASAIPASDMHSEKTCHEYHVPVTLPNDTTVYHVAGWLCYKGSPEGKVVQVLQAGSTYNHTYWDFPYHSQQYSYVDSMIDAGYVTFNMDRIGQGASDHPTDPSEITIQSIAATTHQIIQQLRTGDVNHVHYRKVVLVGHSMGSDMAIQEAGIYHDVDAVIVSGYTHYTTAATLPVVEQDYAQANLQQKFANLSNDYTTTVAGKRGVYYYLPTARQAVIKVDEATKDVVTNQTTSTFLSDLGSHTSNQITVPVLVALGQYDVFNCGDPLPAPQCTNAGIQAYESAYYSPTIKVRYKVFPNTGHVLNLQESSQVWFDYARDWISDSVH